MASGRDSVLGCYGQPWTAVAVGWPSCWGLWDMPHASPSLPHLKKYLLSTCCVSVRDQRSGVSSPSSRADPARALGVVLLGAVFSPRKLTVCTGPGPSCLWHPVPLGQLAGAAGREPAGCCAWSPAAVPLGAREVPTAFGRQCPVWCCPRFVTHALWP